MYGSIKLWKFYQLQLSIDFLGALAGVLFLIAPVSKSF
jgi:hypothetical protein